MKSTHRCACAGLAAALAAGLFLAGCGTPGTPLAPSLNLPDTVTDLSASRAGNQVSLTWTMPKKNTDKLLLMGNVQVNILRNQASGSPPAGQILLAPGADGVFTETLPPTLTTGTPRPLTYFVELKNRNGRSAGLSNPADVLAGQAPSPVQGLAAEVRKQGVVLSWISESQSTFIRLHRKLLTASTTKPAQGPLAPPPEPVEQSLLVQAGTGHAEDKNIRFGQTYEYRAQRVVRVAVDGQPLELAGELSAPLRVEALDVFPPAVPTALAAVASVGENGAETAIDLSWQPVAESDLAGYAVYRRQANGDWQRISPEQPLVPPAFHDAHVEPGRTYRYAVTSIDQGGHQSARSAETEETVPTP